MLPFVSYEQARKRQRDIERVLSIVVDGVDAQITGHFPGEQSFEMLERLLEGCERERGPRRDKQGLDGGEHGIRRAHLDGVGNVKITTPNASHSRVVRAAVSWSPCSNKRSSAV